MLARLQCAQHLVEAIGMKSNRGKPMNLYMKPEDVAKMRELTAYAAENGRKTSDSLIVRAALRLASGNRAFLNALKEADSQDLRFERD
jgi:hypothetical protein